ncbi:hypothetical protein FHG87_002902 [Trinorchestia longiramus]|nr:hypothetical protein FHG87_002902 [Trinorchestia longiramus]
MPPTRQVVTEKQNANSLTYTNNGVQQKTEKASKAKTSFNVLKHEMENNINSTKEQTTQISNEHNPQQTQSHTQPTGILEPIRKSNKITNINLQNFNGTNGKPEDKKKPHVFLFEDSIIQG